jgi:transcriptional regulator with XRE-family HTH domain
MTVEEKLKIIRRKTGLTQKEFADKYGLKLKRIHHLENGEVQKFNDEELEVFATMGYSLWWLIYGEEASLTDSERYRIAYRELEKYCKEIGIPLQPENLAVTAFKFYSEHRDEIKEETFANDIRLAMLKLLA